MAAITDAPSYTRPEVECDLVMKGGATSGLVYPRAVLELARDAKPGESKKAYRFRSIGGASAGAVAAAFTAAAEFQRNNGGFERLNDVNLELQKQKNGGTFLRGLFQASNATQPLFNLFTRATVYEQELKTIARSNRGKNAVRGFLAYLPFLRGLVKDSRVPGVLKGRFYGFVLGVVLAGVLATVIASWHWWVSGSWDALWAPLVVLGVFFGFFGVRLGGLATGLGALFDIVVREVPRNLFGICSGHNEDADKNPARRQDLQAATDWIHGSIQKIAGRSPDVPDEVLTFADLEGEILKKQDKDITLQVMTTNISEGRPYILPFDEHFIYKEADFKLLFPGPVRKKLEAKRRIISGIRLPDGYFFLPKGKDLPVVVAVRLSMSFPLFFSSVPLYALPLWARDCIADDQFTIPEATPPAFPLSIQQFIRTQGEGDKQQSIIAALTKGGRLSVSQEYAPKTEDLIPHWFSDGGIASNFPIHFFDHWLPKWPTFGITLRYLPDYLFLGEKDREQEQATRNYLDSMEKPREPGERDLGRSIRALQEFMQTSIRASGKARPGTPPRAPDVVVLPKPQDGVPLEWEHIHYPDNDDPEVDAVLNFLWAVIKTMQNFRDNSQAALPSYRERVVQVRLRPEEGGFNLGMTPDTIENVVRKGGNAGTALRNDFIKAHHQWVRLRVLVSELNQAFDTMLKNDAPAEYRRLVDDQSGAVYPYGKQDPSWCREFKERLDGLRNVMDAWAAKEEDVGLEAGNPPPILRVTPKV